MIMSKRTVSEIVAKCTRNLGLAVLLTAVLAAAGLGTGSAAQAAQATLSWTASSSYVGGGSLSGPIGYKIHQGTASGNYSQTIDAGAQTSYTANNLSDGATYYFAVSAYDSLGNESALSAEVNKSVPAATAASPLYTLAASAGSGGSITPTGAVVISKGASQSFSITAAAGYQLSGLVVDGASLGALSSYTFSNVNTNHTIAASFALSGAGGSKSAGGPDGILIASPGKTLPAVADALRALQIAVGNIAPTATDLAHGDLSGDGRIDVGDALAILRMVVGA